MINVYTDGGARGNPGPAAIGVFICNEKGESLARFGKYLGETTNNVAEYTAVIDALEWLGQHKSLVHSQSITFYLDSQLVVSQINGVYRVKNPTLRNLLFSVRQKEYQLGANVQYIYIPREKNREADKLVNIALDKRVKLS